MSSPETRATALGVAPEAARVLTTRSIATGLTATGSTLATSLRLAAEHNTIATAAASTGVQLPDWPVGSVVYVRNQGANSLSVYPHNASGTINAGGGGAAQAMAAAAKGRFIRITATNWDYVLEA